MTTLERIKDECRKKKNISITTLEKELGYSNGSLAKAKDIPSSRIYEISKFLDVSVEYLLSGEENETENYYLNDEARENAQFLFENPEYKVLFDASRKVKPEDIEFVAEMLARFAEK